MLEELVITASSAGIRVCNWVNVDSLVLMSMTVTPQFNKASIFFKRSEGERVLTFIDLFPFM